jgi:hypothetical protein
MHVRREDMYICVSSLLKWKIYLHLYDSVGGHLHYAAVEFEVQIYICIVLLEIASYSISIYCPVQVRCWIERHNQDDSGA